MIRVQHLTKEFKTAKKYPGFGGAVKALFSREFETKRAVDDMNFEIGPGELVGYIGVNGAGKSTTIKMMTGILWPTSGSCEVFGVEASRNRRQNAKNIGVVFGQRSQLWWDLPVSESFSILRKIYDVPKDRFEENLAYFRQLLELDEFFTTPVRNLSLGQKMRADFAASMLHDPKVIFLD
ncbi:MAG: ATP-binding cassette domain-containing protein, partial [Spirochaetes bacterium]|nr:ATP-binding cassette domain-containing protein [Spirochaetota bacterium]